MSNRIRLVEIVNDTQQAGQFTDQESASKDIMLSANGSTVVSGNDGDGCQIPDCTDGVWWADRRMTITLGNDVLSLWKEGDRVYCRTGVTNYPGERMGQFLWSDNGLPVILNVASDTSVRMRSRR